MNDFCVYLHRKATNGEIFYVGKGKGRRPYDLSVRNNLWKKIKDKYGVVVEIYAEGLQEWYAYELENLLITGYGKICNNTGILSNILDGHEDRYNSRHGSNSPYAKKGIYTFRRLCDNEVFVGTRTKFEEKYNIRSRPLFVTNIVSNKGWILEDKLLQSEITQLEMRELGIDPWLRDTDLYTFFNVETKEILKCTKFYFYQLGKLQSKQIRKLFFRAGGKEAGRLLKGWAILGITPNSDIESALLRVEITGNLVAKNVDKTIYKFTNILTNEIYIGYRYKFAKHIGITVNRLTSLLNSSTQQIDGWTFDGTV